MRDFLTVEEESRTCVCWWRRGIRKAQQVKRFAVVERRYILLLVMMQFI